MPIGEGVPPAGQEEVRRVGDEGGGPGRGAVAGGADEAPPAGRWADGREHHAICLATTFAEPRARGARGAGRQGARAGRPAGGPQGPPQRPARPPLRAERGLGRRAPWGARWGVMGAPGVQRRCCRIPRRASRGAEARAVAARLVSNGELLFSGSGCVMIGCGCAKATSPTRYPVGASPTRKSGYLSYFPTAK